MVALRGPATFAGRQPIHKHRSGARPACGYIGSLDAFIILWIAVIAGLAIAPTELTKVLLAVAWSSLVAVTLAALVWRGWQALAS